MNRRQLTRRQLADRRAEFDAIAAKYGLTADERRERDNLDHRFYMREWHRGMAASERRSAIGGAA